MMSAMAETTTLYHPRAGRCSVFRGDGSVADLSPEDTIAGEDVLRGCGMRLADLFATS